MLDSLGQENWDFCKIKSSRLLTYVSYVVGPYMLRIKFEENYKVIFSEKIIFLPQFGRELQDFGLTKKYYGASQYESSFSLCLAPPRARKVNSRAEKGDFCQCILRNKYSFVTYPEMRILIRCNRNVIISIQ